MGEPKLADAAQEVRIALEPMRVTAIEGRDEAFGLHAAGARVDAGEDVPEQLVIGDGAVAVQVEADAGEIDRQLRLGKPALAERRADPREVIDAILQDGAEALIGERRRARVA